MFLTAAPYQQYFDADGSPLDAGFVYFGQPNQNPETVPITVYWDEAGTQPAAQPVLTLNGYTVRSGTPAALFSTGDYSVSVKNRRGSLIAYNPSTASYISQLANQTDPTKGTSLIGYKLNATGSVGRTLSDRLSDWVSVKDFGAKGDWNGSSGTDDSAAFTAAFTYLGTSGGVVFVPNFMKCLIDANITVPANVTLRGPHDLIGTPGSNVSTPYQNIGGALIVNSSAKITMLSDSCIQGLLIYRKGMVFPAGNAAAFAGTAIEITGDDASIFGCMVLGFNFGVKSINAQRPRIEYLLADNVNCVDVTNCLDVGYLSNCHCWPFSTIASSGSVADWAVRNGNGFNIHDGADWFKVTNCFTLGYANGFLVSNVNSATFLSCGADGTASLAGSIGFNIIGNSQENRLIGCQASGLDIGFRVATTGGIQTNLVNCNSWGNHLASVNGRNLIVLSGDVSVLGGTFRQGSSGVFVNNIGSRVTITGVRIQDVTTAPIYNALSSPLIFLSNPDFGNFTGAPAIFQGAVQDVPSGATTTVPNSGDVFTVSGTTNFGALFGGYVGRRVTLMFTASVSVFHGGAAPNGILLSGGVTFAAVANSTLSLVYGPGNQWIETGRKA